MVWRRLYASHQSIREWMCFGWKQLSSFADFADLSREFPGTSAPSALRRGGGDRVVELQQRGGGGPHAVEPVVERLAEGVVRPEGGDAPLGRLDAGDGVTERPRLGQQLRFAGRPPIRAKSAR